MVNFPTPMGGTALPADFAPSIVFAILYGLMVPLLVYRLFERRSRTILIIGSFTFSVERSESNPLIAEAKKLTVILLG